MQPVFLLTAQGGLSGIGEDAAKQSLECLAAGLKRVVLNSPELTQKEF